MSLEKDLGLPEKKKKPRGQNGRKDIKPGFTKENRDKAVEAAYKSIEVRRERKRQRTELKEAMSILLSLPATGKVKDMLHALGYEDNEQVNASAIVATLFAMAMNGDSKAMELVLDYGFKVSEDERKTRESNARISAMEKNGVDVSVNSSEDDGGVVIYLPKIEEEEDVQVKEEE